MFPKETCSYSQLLILLVLNRDDLGLGVMSHPTYISVVDLLQVSWLAVASQKGLWQVLQKATERNQTQDSSLIEKKLINTFIHINICMYYIIYILSLQDLSVSNSLSILGSGQDAFRRSSASWANSLPRSSKKKQLFLLFVYSLQELPAT